MLFKRKTKQIVGYTAGVYDLFHIGHIYLLKNAKAMCDKLIVSVSTDECVQNQKNKSPIIPFVERVEILDHTPYVDLVVAQNEEDRTDKFLAWEKYKFDVIFVGDDWKDTDKWNELEKKFKKVGVKVIYFPYTKTTSSTKINNILDTFIEKEVHDAGL